MLQGPGADLRKHWLLAPNRRLVGRMYPRLVAHLVAYLQVVEQHRPAGIDNKGFGDAVARRDDGDEP
jgi:hypothetical protein